MEKRVIRDCENRLPQESLQKEELPGKYAWLINLVNSILRPFLKQGKRKKKLKYKRTEVTRDRYIQQEFIYKEEQTTND